MAKNSHSKLRRLMEKNASFLYLLYKEKNARRTRLKLLKAERMQVWLVLRILFCISVGHIPIRKTHFLQVIRSKRRILLASLKFRFQKLRTSSIREKRKFVLEFASLFPILLYPLFNKTRRKEAKTELG